MSKTSSKSSDTQALLQRKKKWIEREARLKPFGFCCSIDRFDPLSRYDQRMPPYKSSLTSITSVHECPVSKMRVDCFVRRSSRERKKPTRIKVSDAEDQQLPKDNRFLQDGGDVHPVKWCLEDEIALARVIFWTEKQRIYNEESDRAVAIAKKKHKSRIMDTPHRKYPRWYQDFSLKQMENLMNLENVMRADYERKKTADTRTILMAIGVTSTFFKLEPNVVTELHGSCNLNGVCFLREIYRILTGNDFQKEGHKKVYDCNERIILSAIAFLTLPETVKELHRRLPAVIMPRLPPKPKLVCPTRRKSSCPYMEELFRRPDWVGYRNDLQKWRKRRKLIAIPRVILPLKEYSQLLADGDKSSEGRRQKKDDLKEVKTKRLEKTTVKKFDQKEHEDENSASEENLDAKKSEVSDIPWLQDESKKFDFTITGLGEKPGAVEYKICGMLKPPGADKKSWLGEKDPHYIIAGASEDPPSCPVTYEITGVANVTPSNSDERFFAVLKLGDGPRKIFPSGRENLSRNWQEWLQNADEEFGQMEKKANELIKSVRATTRLIFPEPVCDSCCSCRQTRKTREKLRQTKTPYLLIENVLQDENENKYIVGSTVMHSPAPSPTESVVNLLEMVASHDEIKTNIIINGVTDENGKTQYYISGVQKDTIHVPSRMPEPPPASQPVRNVPPCACAIRQLFDKGMSPSASKDNIPWTKDEGLCLGKKYRPDEPAAYSCKMYPGDKSCRRNPFAKEIAKMKRENKEEDGKDETVTTKLVDMVKEQIQVPKKKITEKKKGRFITDPDYPAYDDPWNISRTAPSVEVLETDYEKALKLTSPVLPAITPSKTQETRKNILSFKKLKKPTEKTVIKKIDEEVSDKITLESSKKTQRKEGSERKQMKDTKKKKTIHTSSKKTVADEKDIKLSSKIPKTTDEKTIKLKATKVQSTVKSIRQQQSDKVDKMRRHVSAKKDIKKSTIDTADEADKLDNRKQEMARLKTMMKSYAEVLTDIQPAVLPEEQIHRPELEEKYEEIDESAVSIGEEEIREAAEKGPCGWRTKSEQELSAKKTIVYLCEPDYPLETIAVRPGGQPCRCRENRNKKKILMYNVSGVVDKMDRRRKKTGRMRLEEENRIIDGAFYFTPPISPRRSDEYVPEYDLLKSPYDMCIGEATNKKLKLIEKYSGPRNLIEKIRKRPKPCNCSNYDDVMKENGLFEQKKELEKTRQKLMESISPEERWAMALKDAALMDYFTQPEDNAPCWTSCAKYGRHDRPLRLVMKKPVCECKYERQIVERNEEKAKWKERQQKLKTLKKQPFMHIVDTSRPMVPDTKFIISDVKRIPKEDEYEDDIKYCVTGVAENLSMSPPQRIIDGLKMSTPFGTPKPSKEDIPRDVPHRHWTPIDIPPGPLPRKDAALKEEIERRKKARDEAFKFIYGEKSEQDASILAHDGCQEACDQEQSMKRDERNHETKRSDTSVKKKETLTKLHSSSTEKISSKIEHQQNVLHKEIISETSYEKKKHLEKIASAAGYQQDASYKHMIEKADKKKDDESYQVIGDGDRKHLTGKLDLITIIKTELNKMAAEGYVFATLPKCYLMPQLQDWIMYRKGIALSENDKSIHILHNQHENLTRTIIAIWRLMEKMPMPKIEVPSLHMTKHQLKRLTYNRAEEIKQKIAKKTAIFHSEIRKSRVYYARSMWGTMEFGKFPSASFKRAFFTYMASKEADGHVYKPWMRSEVHERDIEFSCY